MSTNNFSSYLAATRQRKGKASESHTIVALPLLYVKMHSPLLFTIILLLAAVLVVDGTAKKAEEEHHGGHLPPPPPVETIIIVVPIPQMEEGNGGRNVQQPPVVVVEPPVVGQGRSGTHQRDEKQHAKKGSEEEMPTDVFEKINQEGDDGKKNERHHPAAKPTTTPKTHPPPPSTSSKKAKEEAERKKEEEKKEHEERVTKAKREEAEKKTKATADAKKKKKEAEEQKKKEAHDHSKSKGGDHHHTTTAAPSDEENNTSVLHIIWLRLTGHSAEASKEARHMSTKERWGIVIMGILMIFGIALCVLMCVYRCIRNVLRRAGGYIAPRDPHTGKAVREPYTGTLPSSAAAPRGASAHRLDTYTGEGFDTDDGDGHSDFVVSHGGRNPHSATRTSGRHKPVERTKLNSEKKMGYGGTGHYGGNH